MIVTHTGLGRIDDQASVSHSWSELGSSRVAVDPGERDCASKLASRGAESTQEAVLVMRSAVTIRSEFAENFRLVFELLRGRTPIATEMKPTILHHHRRRAADSAA
jgi:hypothetical protein